MARALKRNGHDVTLGSHPCWKNLIEDAGIHFEPIGPDIDIELETAAIRGKNSNPVLSMLKTMQFVFKMIQNSTNEVFEACKGKDLIIVSHSQMGAAEAEIEKLDMFVKAIQKAECRAVIRDFQKVLSEYRLPDTMVACGSVSHSWLFRQGSFVIHHCGFGTYVATLIYGIPSIPIPHILDQLGFAMQLKDINVVTEPLKSKDLSEETIYKAILDMQKSYEEKSRNAKEISEKIKTEGGLSEAVRLIESVL